jgi:DNA-binding NtrC family response regulator
LYARLAGFSVRLLPLRARREDLGLLLSALLRSLAPDRAARLTLSPPLGRALLGYVWPLNIRELVQALSTALVLLPEHETVLDVMHVPQALRRVVLPNDAPESIAALTAPGPRAHRSVTPDTRSTQPAISSPAEARPGWGSATRRGENNDALREELLRQLRTQRGNISEVARLMGRTRMQIHRWMKKFGIDPETFREG